MRWLALVLMLCWVVRSATVWPESLSAGIHAWEHPLAHRLRLGDGSYTASRAANLTGYASDIQPEWHHRFTHQSAEPVMLRLGSIQGLDTAEAHQQGQSRANSISSPLEIWVNGRLFQQVYTNGQGATWTVPTRILRSENELVIKAGQRLEGPLDIDDCEIEGVWLLSH